jgi:hypothetical protein
MAEPRIDLTTLQQGFPALTPAAGLQLAEAAAVCLEERGHANEVVLSLCGKWTQQYQVVRPDVTSQMRRCYNDPEEATEWGACGLALLLMRDLSGFSVVERSRRGTGFDYWLGDLDESAFQQKVKLEVSGIRRGNMQAIAARIGQKRRQTERATGTEATYLAVVEFGQPTARVEER